MPEGATDAESGLLVFPVEEVELICREFETAVPLQALAEHLGASMNQAQALYSAGIISPLIPPGGPGSVRKVVFGRSHLNGFLSRIEAMEVVPAEFRGEIVSISVACQREGGTTPDLVQAIWDRRIMAWRDPLHTGLRSILVRLCDVRVLRERAGRALA